MDSEAKQYEVAYLVSSSVNEEDVLAHAGTMSALIEGEHGAVRHLERPKKRKLAYPVKKEKSAYFGWTTFTMAPRSVLSLDTKIKIAPNILRHMIVEEEVETRRPFVPVHQRSSGIPPQQKVIPREEQKPEEKLDLEALDKKLEEILGK